MRDFDHNLAKTDPKNFLIAAGEHMVSTTELGAALWNSGISHGTLDLADAHVNPETWVSGSKGGGYLMLGAAPMGDTLRNKLVYLGENLSYKDEVSRRLLHELGHGAFFLAQYDPEMRGLHLMAHSARSATDGSEGLTPLGSLDFYERSAKPAEDVTELITMRAISESHLDGYLDFLSDPRYAGLRKKLGVVTLQKSAADALGDQVDAAITEVLRKPARPR